MNSRGRLKAKSASCAVGAVLALFSLAANEPSTAGPPPSQSETPSRIYADAFLVWIYKSPRRDVTPIGYIRGGDSVQLRATDGVPAGTRVKRGCGKGWYAVEPAGYVCLDRQASLQPTRYSESMSQLAPQSGAYPFDFALSMGTPSYRRVPTLAEWKRKERIFGEAKPRPLPPHWRGHEELVTDNRLEQGATPSFLEGRGSVSRFPENRLVRREVPFGSMLAITSSFESQGRQFLQSADGTIVPADRFRLFKPSKFEGVTLSQHHQLPLAWPRKKTRKYRISHSARCAIDGSGTGTKAQVAPSGKPRQLGTRPAQLPQQCLHQADSWALQRQVIQLTGRTVDVSGTRFAELGMSPSANSHWIPTRYLYIAETKEKRSMKGTDQKWIHFTISQGTLVTYRGETPIFSTLASPGIGGVPARGADPLSTRTTPVGTYRIQFKHRTDDMSPEQTEDRSYWIADVPYAMYFKQPFAIHVAYWHESFGEPMSGGCINVSPKDGLRLFSFADPQLPPHWYGVGASKALGYGTTVIIER